MNNLEFKVVLVGDAGVGKTCLVRALTEQNFDERYKATIGVEIVPFEQILENKRFIFNIWDVAGQENLGGVRDGYYAGGQ